MNESDLVNRWEEERTMYEAWACFISNEIQSRLQGEYPDFKLSEFFKIPPTPRSKETSSLIDKAFYRKKSYTNPYYDITDKVGIRFVVLLTSDIKKVEQIVTSSVNWNYSKDRDYENERKIRPLEFTYQSVHYVLKPVRVISHNNIDIDNNVSCEVQIRTLLQHAHSELTHDSVYKPKKEASSEVQRTIARSMALIETTDDFFEQATRYLQEETKRERHTLFILEKLYTINFPEVTVKIQKSNSLIVEAFLNDIPNDIEEKLNLFLKENSYILKKIKINAEFKHLYTQPSILLTFFLTHQSPVKTKELWPLTESELSSVYSILGKSFNDF